MIYFFEISIVNQLNLEIDYLSINRCAFFPPREKHLVKLLPKKLIGPHIDENIR